MVRKLVVCFLSPLKGLGFVPISLGISGVEEREDVVVDGAWGDGVRVGGLGLLGQPKEPVIGDTGLVGTGATTGGGVGTLGGGGGGGVACLLGAREGMRDGGLTPDGAGVLSPVWGAGFSEVPESHWFASTKRTPGMRFVVSGYGRPVSSVI